MSALSFGCGQVVQIAAGGRIPGLLLLPTGFAAVAVGGQLGTMYGATARFATPAVVAIAVVGGAVSWPWERRRIDPSPFVAALGAFFVFAAPVVLSGSA